MTDLKTENEETFECYWCKVYAELDKEEYTYPQSDYGNTDSDGNIMCQGCWDNAV